MDRSLHAHIAHACGKKGMHAIIKTHRVTLKLYNTKHTSGQTHKPTHKHKRIHAKTQTMFTLARWRCGAVFAQSEVKPR